MRINFIYIFIIALFLGSCEFKTRDTNRAVAAEVYGNYLYLDEVQKIIPPNTNRSDSTELADKYIRKWATDILMYEKAIQNTFDLKEIDRLVNEYRKTLVIHQYQQRLVEQRSRKKPTEKEMMDFYDAYSTQMVLKENIIKGLLLILPEDAPNMDKVLQWVKKADQKSIENIEKYSLQNAISYDYFMDTWVPFAEVARKAPFQSIHPSRFISTNNIVEANDSTHHYFLRIEDYRIVGQSEPYDLAKDKISNIISTKNNADLISDIESQLYDDAIKHQILKLYSGN